MQTLMRDDGTYLLMLRKVGYYICVCEDDTECLYLSGYGV